MQHIAPRHLRGDPSHCRPSVLPLGLRASLLQNRHGPLGLSRVIDDAGEGCHRVRRTDVVIAVPTEVDHALQIGFGAFKLGVGLGRDGRQPPELELLQFIVRYGERLLQVGDGLAVRVESCRPQGCAVHRVSGFRFQRLRLGADG